MKADGRVAYPWLLFDADGTLFDYDAAESAALSTTFHDFGENMDPGFLGIYREINAGMWRAFEMGTMTQDRIKSERFERFLAAIDSESDASLFSRTYMSHLARQTALIDDALATVERLSRRSELLLITNGLRDIQRPRFAASRLHDYFRDIVISEEIGSAKPDSGIFKAAFSKIENPAKGTVLMIGDSLTSDIAGGNAFGIDTCWFNPERLGNSTGATPTFEIGSLPELVEIVENGNSPDGWPPTRPIIPRSEI